jgi:hypothetical protein
MVMKGGNKMALKWVPLSFEESDLKKAKKDGFLPEAAPIIFPDDERVPPLPQGYRVMFLAFLLRGLSLPAQEFLFSISHALSLFVSLFLESTHTGFFGSFFSASAQAFL